MKQYLFSTIDFTNNINIINDYINTNNNYIDNACDIQNLQSIAEDITLHEINDTLKDNVIFIGESKIWNDLVSFSYYGNFISLYKLLLADCIDYSLYIENELLKIYGIYNDGYVKANIYLLNRKGKIIYSDWKNDIRFHDMNEQQIIKYIITHHLYLNSGNVINSTFQ